MTLSASAAFIAAENADVRKVTAKVYLVLGNYCPKYYSFSTGDDYSADYPVSGAIDGDHTELNVGAYTGAENDIGLGGWRSTNQPDSTPASMSVAFGEAVAGAVKTPRIINRIKVYHMTGHAMSQYAIFGDSTNSLTHDLKLATTAGYTSPGGVTITTTGTVDIIEIADTTVYGLQIICSDTTVLNDQAWVVELEAYRLVDITDYVMAVQVDRSRDYKLQNPIAASVNVLVDNSNRFFSFDHTPSAAETTAGFVNAELVPNIGIEVKFGYDFGGLTETVKNFVGNVDKLTVTPKNRTATLEGRDFTKVLLNNYTSSKLKSALDIGALVQYICNLVGISTFESLMDNAAIVVDYFFTEAESALSTIQNLIQAAGDSVFYFSETGIATFKAFLNSIAQSHLWTSQADFVACTVKTNIDTDSVVDAVIPKWYLIDDFADGDYTSNPQWIDVLTQYNWVANSSNGIRASNSGGAADAFYYIDAFPAQVTGTWEMTMKFAATRTYDDMYFYFVVGSISLGAGFPRFLKTSYAVQSDRVSNLLRLLVTDSSGNITVLASTTQNPGTSVHTVRVTRTTAGVMNVYWDGTLKLTATDTSVSTGIKFCALAVDKLNGGGSGDNYFNNIRYSFSIDGTTAYTAADTIIESQVIDQSAAITSEGIFQASTTVDVYDTIDFYTDTSSDGTTFPDGYTAVTNGGTIASTMRRYIKWKAVLKKANYYGKNGPYGPIIFDVTVNWVKGGGSVKYPASASATFSYNSSLLNISQEYADNLGGDTTILNDVSVQGHPLLLTGSNSDELWYGTVQIPPVKIDGSNTLGVTNGDILIYTPIISGGMDVSRMTGANPAAAAVSFGSSATGSWKFTTINPTHPVLQITITHTGTITNLQILGKVYADSKTLSLQRVKDSSSIKSYGLRQTQIDNNWISNDGISLTVANAILANFKDPVIHIYQCEVTTSFLLQIGDRVTIVDTNLDISADYYVTGYTHIVQAGISNGVAKTVLKLFKI